MKKVQAINKNEIFTDIEIIYKKYNVINQNIYYKEGKFTVNNILKLFNCRFNDIIKEFNLNNVNNFETPEKQSITKKERSHSANTKQLLSDKQKQFHINNSDKIFNFTKEEAIKLGQQMFEEKDEILKHTFLEYSNYDPNTFLNMFSTFSNFLRETNLYESMKIINNTKKGSKNNNFSSKEYVKIKDFTKEDCFNKAKEILQQENNLNKQLFLEKSNYDRFIFLNMFKNSFRQFLKEAKLDEELKIIRRQYDNKCISITKQETINIILECKNTCLESFTAEYLYANTNITQNIIKLHFGTFTKMLKELNLPINIRKNITKEEIIEKMLELYNQYGKLTSEMQREYYPQSTIDNLFGSFNDMLRELNIKENMAQNVTDDELLDELSQIIKKHGTINSILIDNECKYSRPTYLYRLGGSIASICEKLNIINLNNVNSCISNTGIYCNYLISKILNSNCIFEKTFSWLKYNGNKLRLDGYFEEYNLAIEYDGIQHYEYTKKFDKEYEEFLKRQERDRIKDKLCKENGIKLIRIRYDEPLTEEYLKQKLIKEGIIKE
jgi:hypothetical protein